MMSWMGPKGCASSRRCCVKLEDGLHASLHRTHSDFITLPDLRSYVLQVHITKKHAWITREKKTVINILHTRSTHTNTHMLVYQQSPHPLKDNSQTRLSSPQPLPMKPTQPRTDRPTFSNSEDDSSPHVEELTEDTTNKVVTSPDSTSRIHRCAPPQPL
jgi:hypothetical protein